MNVNKIFITLFVTAIPFWGIAQDELNKTVQVTKNYDPIISDAEKIELPVSINDTLLNIKGDYQYSIKQLDISSNLALRPIPAAKISENAYKDPQWLYARLGAGYPLRFLGDLYIQNIKPENISYGLFYNHRSIWTKVDNPDGENIPIDEMNHQATAFFRKNWEKLSFNINGGFNQHNVLFYGYNTAVARNAGYVFNKDSLSQSYTSFNFAAGVKSFDLKENVFRYKVNLLFDVFGDNGKNKFNKGRLFSMGENKFGAEMEFGFALGDAHLIALQADGDLYMRNLRYNKEYNSYFSDPTLMQNALYNSLFGISGAGRDISDSKYIYNVSPTYRLASSKIDLELGVKYTGFQKDNGLKHRVYPVVNASLKLIDEFVPFAGIDGGVAMNDYRSVTLKNPFIAPGMNMAMNATDCSYAISAGAKGNIENVFVYNVYGKYSLLKDFYFFVNSDQTLLNSNANAAPVALGNNFDAVYDDIQQLKVAAELKLSAGIVDASLSAAYYSYTLDKLQAAFHLPTYTLDLNVDVAVTKSLTLNLNGHARSETAYFYSAASGETSYNDAFLDLGIGAEYLFNRSFSVFLNANNLLDNRYLIWHGYKVPGLGVLGGITFKF